MNTLEGNKLIASFMGFEDAARFVSGSNAMRKATVWKYGCQQYEQYGYDEMKFHTSWDDWLMTVVEKIENLSTENFYKSSATDKDFYCTVSMNTTESIITVHFKNLDPSNFRYKVKQFMVQGTDKLDTTYRAVLEFIQWYNNQK